MRKQIDIFFTAVMLLTRIQVPRRIHHDGSMLQRSVRYFPLVGIVVGLLTSGALLFFQLFLSPGISILLSIITGILITGAFHEDGFADVCDGFGGGWTKEKILLIMKDSRLGTYGVIGLVTILSLKFMFLLELLVLPGNIFWTAAIITAAHSISRLMPLLLMRQHDYVTGEQSKSAAVAESKPKGTDLAFAAVIAICPLIFFDYSVLLSVPLLSVITLLSGRYFHKWIGGYTGDCLGAVQQITEVSFYLVISLLWKYIL